jgi:RNA polymerase sigma-70 factor (ECF subfamily)
MTSSSFDAHQDADDMVLLDAACAGDEHAFRILLARHRHGLATVCCLMLGDPELAEHAAHEVVLTAWRERALGPASSSARIWVYRIALRVCAEALEISADEFAPRRAFDG